MKTRYLVLTIIIIFVAICSLILTQKLIESKQPVVGEFNLAQYQWELETFPSNSNIGQIKDANDAIKKAESLWSGKYDTSTCEGIEIAYDSQNECWHVKGVSSPNVLGGVLHVIVHNNGDVLAVWGED